MLNGLTNGEGAELVHISAFLQWMAQEDQAIPQNRKDLLKLLRRWLKHDRAEKMRYVNELRLARGEEKLPAWLAKAPTCKVCNGDGKIMSASGDPKRPLRAIECTECGSQARAAIRAARGE